MWRPFPALAAPGCAEPHHAVRCRRLPPKVRPPPFGPAVGERAVRGSAGPSRPRREARGVERRRSGPLGAGGAVPSVAWEPAVCLGPPCARPQGERVGTPGARGQPAEPPSRWGTRPSRSSAICRRLARPHLCFGTCCTENICRLVCPPVTSREPGALSVVPVSCSLSWTLWY